MKKITILTLLTFGFFLFSTSLFAQERVGEQIDKTARAVSSIGVIPMSMGVTAEQMVAALIGAGITPTNVVYTGAPVASGLFNGGYSGGLGIDQGVILSCGLATNVIGPNVSGSISAINGVAGDVDLNALIPQSTNDASVLEFDFVPTDRQLEIRFVFGSDEYNEWVGQFNDVFAFFLDGVNIALIPGTSIPVSINNVNNGANSTYYNDNATIPSPNDTEMDGFTTMIIGTATVTPGQTHHIKLAIADAGDSSLDSWVMIEGDSFGPPPGVPISDWAIYLGIFLIAAFMVLRYRRRLA